MWFLQLNKHFSKYGENVVVNRSELLVLLTASILIGAFCPGKLITGENVN
jgi:hypothetical protein